MVPPNDALESYSPVSSELSHLQYHWLHVMCARAEWYSKPWILQAVAVQWDVKYAENWRSGL